MVKLRKYAIMVLGIWALMNGVGCSSYREIGEKTSQWIDQKNYTRVLEYYDDQLKESTLDRLLYLMDKGVVLQMAGKYEESKQFLFSAEQLADELDAISITSQTGALLSNDEALPYKGEDYEKVMINVFNAFNFIALGDYQGALIECKRASAKLEVLQQHEGQQYKEDPFVYYLSAILYETLGEINDAYIDYKRAFQLNPDFPYLQNDLLSLASQLGFSEDVEKWKEHYSIKLSSSKIDSNQGELVVFYSAGKSPEKLPHQRSASSLYIGYAVAGSFGASVGGDFLVPVPRFKKRPYQWQQMKIFHAERELARSHELEDLETVGIKSLRDRLGREVIRAVARLAMKAKLQDEIRKKFGGVAGLVAGAGMLLTQKADTRSWLTLPASLQIARVHLNPGEYHLTLKFYDRTGSFIKGEEQHKVLVQPGKKTFLYVRTTK